MTTEEQKKLYESAPEEWVVYIRDLLEYDKFNKIAVKPQWKEEASDYRLIHKRHEHISDEVIKNPDVVVVEYKLPLDRLFNIDDNFFSGYYVEHEYRLATKDEVLALYYENKDLLSEGE